MAIGRPVAGTCGVGPVTNRATALASRANALSNTILSFSGEALDHPTTNSKCMHRCQTIRSDRIPVSINACWQCARLNRRCAHDLDPRLEMPWASKPKLFERADGHLSCVNTLCDTGYSLSNSGLRTKRFRPYGLFHAATVVPRICRIP